MVNLQVLEEDHLGDRGVDLLQLLVGDVQRDNLAVLAGASADNVLLADFHAVLGAAPGL